jgi:hypothetical protein
VGEQQQLRPHDDQPTTEQATGGYAGRLPLPLGGLIQLAGEEVHQHQDLKGLLGIGLPELGVGDEVAHRAEIAHEQALKAGCLARLDSGVGQLAFGCGKRLLGELNTDGAGWQAAEPPTDLCFEERGAVAQRGLELVQRCRVKCWLFFRTNTTGNRWTPAQFIASWKSPREVEPSPNQVSALRRT